MWSNEIICTSTTVITVALLAVNWIGHKLIMAVCYGIIQKQELKANWQHRGRLHITTSNITAKKTLEVITKVKI